MSIKITKTVPGFSVTFPFPLLDSFKYTFPSAVFNAWNKTWSVGPRSGKRLEDWATKNWPAPTAKTPQAIVDELNSLQIPGYRFSRENDRLCCTGEFHPELHTIIQKIGGRWIGKSDRTYNTWTSSQTYVKAWKFPGANAGGLAADLKEFKALMDKEHPAPPATAAEPVPDSSPKVRLNIRDIPRFNRH